jgi:hypothetical protein
MSVTPRSIDLARSGPYFAALLALALVAFWPTYLSKVLDTSNVYIHLHAITAALWVLMLVVQPLTISARRFTLHRNIGSASYVLAPLIVVVVVLLAHSRIQGLEGQAYGLQTYVLYLQLSLAALFGLSYALAMRTRRMVAQHARFMVCTGLTMIDPVVIRLMFWWDATPAWNYQWLTFGLTDLVLVVSIWMERHRPTGRTVFPAMLVLFVLMQTPALLGLTHVPAWQAFARWFAALPLT